MKPSTAATLRALRHVGDAGLTRIEAIEAIGVMNLPGRVLELKAAGFDIRRADVRLPNGKRVGRYFLHESEENAA